MDIIRLSYQNNIRVILARTPTTKEFREARSAQWNEELSQLYSKCSTTYPAASLSIWDINKLEPYPISMFKDPNHLTDTGLLRYNRNLDLVFSAQIE